MTWRILIAGPEVSLQGMELAKRSGAEVVSMKSYPTAREIAETAAVTKPQAIIARTGEISEEVLQVSSELRVIVKHGVGTDRIDVDAASRRGVPVLITSGANSQAVAEHALALMFSVARSTVWLDKRTRQGQWDKASHVGVELRGKSLGIVGLGSIGRILCSLVVPLEMSIGVFDPYLTDAGTLPSGAATAEFDDLLEQSDIISLHCPLTPETREIIGASQLKKMKRSAILINTARGGLIDEVALEAALRERWIYGAGLDTFAREPPATDNDLWKLPNLVATPHIGANTAESMVRMGVQAMILALQYLEGGTVEAHNIINPAAIRAA